ncbi:BRO family, N-terminal domain [Aquimarina amphilecti]|uniref:BRO family, N-terminal domain n=1 Tax=Aquimarina amphilecti TaxID=1038014 RepID=A0A1H7M8I4_AQUAM|nr:Bro-N domain-containing protein [Aquimarina amphilecti]SEL06907.1 BRO family, N-terminal domain [Aquimarina amphilecti]
MDTQITKKRNTTYFQKLTSIEIDGQIWFVIQDVGIVMGLSNPIDTWNSLDPEERFATEIYKDGRIQMVNLISESGLYGLIFNSDTKNAKRFKKWVTNEVLPLIRVKGYYHTKRLEIPNFVIRFNDNWDRVSSGYFSVLSELFIRLYGRFEQEGYILPNYALDGKEIRPDISVAIHFDKYLERKFPQYNREYGMYQHRLPSGQEIEVKQYKNHLLPIFINFIDNYWLKEYASEYFEKRDSKALEYLPKLLKS